MAFDADAYAEALKPWTLKVRGVTFTARLWSARQAAALAAGWDKCKLEEEHRELWDGVLRRLFPWQLSYWWLGNPRKLFWSALTPKQQRAAIQDFFEYLARQYAPQRKTTASASQPRRAPQKIETAQAFRSLARSQTSKRTSDPRSSSTRAAGQPLTDTSRSTSSGGTGQ